MSLLSDFQNAFGGPRRVRIPDFLTDTLTANIDAGGHRIVKQIGEAVNLLDYADRDVETDQDTNINAAITAAVGRILYVPKGTWFIGSGCTLLSNTTIIAEPGSMFKALRNDDYFVVLQAAAKYNIRISGLTLDGFDTETTVALMQFYNCHEITIEGCTFQNSRGLAINLSTDIVNATIKSNRFYRTGNPDEIDAGARAVTIALTELLPGASHHLKVSDNSFEDIGLEALSISGTYDAVFKGNTLTGGSAGILYSAGGVGLNSRWTVSDNICMETGSSGNAIDLVGLSHSTISNNILNGNGAGGILLSTSQNIALSSNICANNGQEVGSPYRAGIVIRNNDGGSENVVLSDNICTDDQSPKTQLYGLLTQNFSGLKINPGNLFTGNSTAPIGVVDNDLVVIGTRQPDEADITPTLQNSWIDLAGSQPARYFKDALGIVHVIGIISSGTVTPGTTLFNLPVGYRPAFDVEFACGASGYGEVTVKQNGNVNIQIGANTGFGLSNISFRAV